MQLKDMDIIYPYKLDGLNGRELKYSLRSIAKNVPHRNVILIGEAPSRINKDTVRVIPFEDNLDTKYLNVRWKLMRIFHDDTISKNFIWMNDDMLVMQPITDIPPYSWWTLAFHAEKVNKRSWPSPYYEILKKTDKLCHNEGFSYEVHVPFIFNKDKLMSLFDEYENELEGCAIRSVYWNKFCKPVFFEEEFGRTDCKSYSWRLDELGDLNNITYISTYDEVKYAYAKRLDSKLEKCIYEL